MPLLESLMNMTKTSELNNSPTTNSMKDKPPNVKMNSLSEVLKSPMLKVLYKKDKKPLMVANNKESELLKILVSPKNN
jgi:hypothetical protein